MSHMSWLMQSEQGWERKSLSWFPINWEVRETDTCQFQTEQAEAMAVSKIVLGFIFLGVHLVIDRWSKVINVYQYYFPQVALAASNRKYDGPYSERAPSFVTLTRAEQPRACKWRLSFEKIITVLEFNISSNPVNRCSWLHGRILRRWTRLKLRIEVSQVPQEVSSQSAVSQWNNFEWGEISFLVEPEWNFVFCNNPQVLPAIHRPSQHHPDCPVRRIWSGRRRERLLEGGLRRLVLEHWRDVHKILWQWWRPQSGEKGVYAS